MNDSSEIFPVSSSGGAAITARAVAARVDRAMLVHLIATAIFLATSAYTVHCTRSMARGMTMPGGWSMSMMWMPMPGQSLLSAASMFIAMWTAMMVAMMLPSTMPTMLVYRRVLNFHRVPNAGQRLAAMICGYFAVWAGFGAIVVVAGFALARAEMASESLSRAVPMIAGLALILSGLYQFTPWKSSCLRHCRDPISLIAEHLHGGRWGAVRLGLHQGIFCSLCCWSLMLIQIVFGMMNLVVMAGIALIIALEKMLPAGHGLARATGAIAIVGGIVMLARPAILW